MAPRRSLLVAFLLCAGLFAGCVGDANETDGARSGAKSLSGTKQEFPGGAWSELALTAGELHDHANPLHHEGFTTPNFELLGHDPLISPEYGTTAFGHLCGDAKATQDGRRIAAIESRSDVAFTLVDVTDPLAPKMLGELVMKRTYVYDLAVVPDGRHVVLVTTDVAQPDPRAQADGSLVLDGMEWRSPCADGPVPLRWDVEDPVPRPFSLLLVNIADPKNPTVIDQRPLSGYGHSVFATILDGRTWVVASLYLQNSGLSGYQFYEIVAAPAGSRLNHLSTFFPATVMPQAEWTRSLGHTDAWIHKHPKTGKTLAWLAHWNSGLLIVDLTNPQAPQLVGRWTDYDPVKGSGDSGQTHSAYVAPELWDGRHYTIIGPEHPSRPVSMPTGLIWVLDTTDPANIKAVANWTLPHDVAWTGRLMFSLHYLTVVNRTLLVSAYHAGIWALDLSGVGPDTFTQLSAVGAFVPNLVSPKPPAKPFRWAPTIEEVLSFPDGTFVTFDSNSGVYTARFDEANPMPPPEPWRWGAPKAV